MHTWIVHNAPDNCGKNLNPNYGEGDEQLGSWGYKVRSGSRHRGQAKYSKNSVGFCEKSTINYSKAKSDTKSLKDTTSNAWLGKKKEGIDKA